MNAIQDLVEGFDECKFSLIPRLQNIIADSLATSAAVFKIPIHSSKKYEVEVRNKPFVPDNVKSWQVFEDDTQIRSFLHLEGMFKNLVIEESDSPPDTVPHSEEVELSQATTFEEEAQVKPVDPIDTAIKGGKETDRPDSQRMD